MFRSHKILFPWTHINKVLLFSKKIHHGKERNISMTSRAMIWFQFEDPQSARLAFDTLQELGYQSGAAAREANKIQIHVDHSDLTSALEIAQAHGGMLMDAQHQSLEGEVYSMAYDMEQVNIPAHVVNEDWPDGYAVLREESTNDARSDGELF
jgi:hypothetical protein